MNTIFAKILYELEKNHDLVLVTLIAENGSAPRGTGSQMLVNMDGRLLGTIGGGAVEYDAEQLALRLVAEKRSCVHDYVLRKNKTEDLGMVCGGDVTAYFQFIDHTDARWGVLAGAVCERAAARKPGSPAGWSSGWTAVSLRCWVKTASFWLARRWKMPQSTGFPAACALKMASPCPCPSASGRSSSAAATSQGSWLPC